MKVTYIDHMGSDLSVVNAARVSFGKVSTEFSEADEGLIKFLARGCTTSEWSGVIEEANSIRWDFEDFDEDIETSKQLMEDLFNYVKKMPDHWTPFGHTAITLHFKAPIFVARQLGKHQVGFVWNEVSRRYVSDEPEFFLPDDFRDAAENVKQGSKDGPALNNEKVRIKYQSFMKEAALQYNEMLRAGICPEQARMVLPQSMYTEWYWTGNLYGFANVYNQRTDSHAQKEVQDVAHQIGEIIEPLFPVSWRELTK